MSALTNGGDTLPPDEPPTIMYIGQHETRRSESVTPELLRRAQDAGYDLLTAPITSPTFQSRILELLQDHVDILADTKEEDSVPLPLISPLTPKDTLLAPEDSNSSLIAVISPWIDLGSPDPLIAHISRQVFNLEVAYAAFVGISNVLVHGPLDHNRTTHFSRALLEGLGLGPYVQLHVLLPTSGDLEQDVSEEGTHLSELVRSQYTRDDWAEDEEPDAYEVWEMWHKLRTVCSYSSRLSIGTQKNHPSCCLSCPALLLLRDAGFYV